MTDNFTDITYSIGDNRGRRKGCDRRQYTYTIHIPERRSGSDRRDPDDRRKEIRKEDQLVEP